MSIQNQLEGNNYIWALKYRPKSIDKLILPQNIKDRLKIIIEKQTLPNLLLNGQAGIGKTSSAYVLAKEFNAKTLYINGSLQTSIDTVRQEIVQFASTKSFDNAKKIVIMDEFDRMSPNAQDSLKTVLETHSKVCSFIFLTNHKERIIAPLKSRVEIIDFIFTEKKDILAMKKQLLKELLNICELEKVKYTKENLKKIIQKYFPDMRKILIEAQKMAENNELNKYSLEFAEDITFDTLIDIIHSKNYSKLCNYVASLNMDANNFYSWFEKQIPQLIKHGMKKEYIGWLIILLNKYAYESYFVTDQTINLKAFLMELMTVEGGLF